MNIQTATKKALKINGSISRKKWIEVFGKGFEIKSSFHGTQDLIDPTKKLYPAWNPMGEDLVANDWFVVKGMEKWKLSTKLKTKGKGDQQ